MFCVILFLNVVDYVFNVKNIFMEFFTSRGKMGKKIRVVEFFIFSFFYQKTVIVKFQLFFDYLGNYLFICFKSPIFLEKFFF